MKHPALGPEGTAGSAVRAVIMAGGSGTRFWPRSRRSFPKQFLPLGGAQSLLRECYERVAPLCGPDGVAVVARLEHLPTARRILPEVPARSFLGEPVGRDTAACVGFAAEWLRAEGPAGGKEREETVMLVCPSDHRIAPRAVFEEAARSAASIAARTGALVTFGIEPRGPSSAFGYIQRGAPLEEAVSMPAFRVRRFVEKPDRARAEQLLREGGHYWNSGIFLFRVDAIRRAMTRFFPELAKGLESMGRALAAGAPPQRVLAEGFPALPGKSLDRAVMEKAAEAGEVVVAAAPFEWDDLGSWSALARRLPPDAAGNHVEGLHLGLDTRDCIISGTDRRLIATVGIEGLVVVESNDAVLVCRREDAERVKELVDLLESRGEGGRT